MALVKEMNQEQKAILNHCLEILATLGDKYFAEQGHESYAIDRATHALAMLQNLADPEQVEINRKAAS